MNWMRLKRSCTMSASVSASSVLPNPGTPSMSTCPPATAAMSNCSMASVCPTTALASSCRRALKSFWKPAKWGSTRWAVLMVMVSYCVKTNSNMSPNHTRVKRQA